MKRWFITTEDKKKYCLMFQYTNNDFILDDNGEKKKFLMKDWVVVYVEKMEKYKKEKTIIDETPLNIDKIQKISKLLKIIKDDDKDRKITRNILFEYCKNGKFEIKDIIKLRSLYNKWKKEEK